MISVVLLGAGNVATHLFKAFFASEDVEVKQWYNRNIKTIDRYKSKVAITDHLSDLVESDIYILAISDDAIETVSKHLPFENRLVVHTSGSTSLYAVDKEQKRGVFYPLQTFSKAAEMDFANVPICIEALKKADLPILKKLANAIGSKSHKVNSDQRQGLHLAAVFVNNFTNQLYRVAHEITEANGAEFDILKPLIKETANKIETLSPLRAQTGPALRNDKKTIKRHIKQLESKHHKELYELLTQSIKRRMAYDKSYKEYLEQISTFVFDVDGVLTDGSLLITTEGDMLRSMNVKDGYALKQALNKGYNICIISGGTNEGVKKRLNHLGIKTIYLGAHQKIEPFQDYIKAENIKPKHVLYMGDDIPDIPVMKLVGLATCPQDAVQEIKSISHYISHKLGGKGCVRDVIEQVLKVRGDWDGGFDASI